MVVEVVVRPQDAAGRRKGRPVSACVPVDVLLDPGQMQTLAQALVGLAPAMALRVPPTVKDECEPDGGEG